MSGKGYVYNAEALLDDGAYLLLDLEEQGWADKERLAHTVRWSLVPKGNASPPLDGTNWPTVIVAIPPNAKPVFKARSFGKVRISSSDNDMNAQTSEPLFLCYGIGWKDGSDERIVWVLPTGDVEFGTNPTLADLILRNTSI